MVSAKTNLVLLSASMLEYSCIYSPGQDAIQPLTNNGCTNLQVSILMQVGVN